MKKIKKSVKAHHRKRTHRHTGIFCSCQGGMSPKLIAIGGAIILAVAAGGYFLFNNSSSPAGGIINKITNPAGNKITESYFANIKDPLLQKYYTAQWNAKKIRTKMPLADMKGAVLVYEVEMLGDLTSGKYNSYTWRDQNGTKKAEYMTVDKTTYVKDYSDNKWWKQTRKEDQAPTDSPQNSIKEEFDNIINEPTPEPSNEPKKIGEEPCPNITSLTCYKYSETSTFMDKPVTSIFWFDNKEYLKRKEMDENGESWTLYEYDNINIAAPSPTKEVPAGRDIYEYTTQSYLKDLSPDTGSTQQPIQQYVPPQQPIQEQYTPPQDTPIQGDYSETPTE